MPRYRFNLHLEGQVLRDREGQYFSGPDTVWDIAQSLASELIEKSIVQPSNWLKCHLEVVDDRGEVVVDVPFTEAAERQKKLERWTSYASGPSHRRAGNDHEFHRLGRVRLSLSPDDVPSSKRRDVMTKQFSTFLAAGLLGLTFTAGGAFAQAQPLINCADSAFASQPECLGRGKTGPQVQGNPSAVTPAARTDGATTATGSVAGQNMINCADQANASQPECLGRGKTGPKMEGNPSAVTPAARTNKVPGG